MNEPLTITDVEAFIREHHVISREWPHGQMATWLNWLSSIEAIMCVTDDERMTGIGIARPVASLAEGMQPYTYRPKGTILWVDMIIATNTAAIPHLWKLAVVRFGERLFVGGYQSKRNRNRYALFPWGDYMERVNRRANRKDIYGNTSSASTT